MRIQTVVFDFGNVIGFFDHGRTVEKLVPFTPLGPVELSKALYSAAVVDGYEVGGVTTEVYTANAIRAADLSCGVEFFVDAFADIFTPNPEVLAVVPRLKPTYRLCLGSNTVDVHYRRYCDDFADTLRHFDSLGGASHLVRARKPDPAFYERVHETCGGVEPGAVLFVDDLPVNIAAAERFGWQGLLYTPDGTLEQKLRARGVELR